MILSLDKLRKISNVMKRCIMSLFLALFAMVCLKAQEPTFDRSIVYAERDTCSLIMDLYMPADTMETHPCMIYLYGGGFVENNLRCALSRRTCRAYADKGYVTLAVDYRLGLKGVKFKNPVQMIKPLERAVNMASEDLFSAVEYLLAHAGELKIDPSKIILSGSSAGAVTVLQTDYELCNRTSLSAAMPDDFRFAGVISYAGAIFSREGKCDYKVHEPAPTFFLHGTADNLVVYDKIQVFRTGFFGSASLVKRFEKGGWPYLIARFEDNYHEVAAFNLTMFDETLWFIDNYVNKKMKWQMDLMWDRPKAEGYGFRLKPNDCYK